MKRAFITAATSSIGKIIATKLHRQGYELVLHYNTSSQRARELAASTQASLICADLMDETAIKKLISDMRAMPKFDLIVNNAGKSAVFDDHDLHAYERVFRMNAVVPALIMAAAPEIMNLGGCIINISSIYGDERFGDTDMIAYSASKAALQNMTRTFAKKLAPAIRVNAVAPGFVESAWNKDYSKTELARIEKMQLTECLVTPEQVADLTLHIAENSSLAGEIVYLDGGQTLKRV